MKLNFTLIGVVCMLMMGTSLLHGQLNNFTVTAPSDIAGDYAVGQPGWAMNERVFIDTGGVATFVTDGVDPVTDACETPIEGVQGKIAFIDRGSCQFGVKFLNAQNAGAEMAVICNINPGEGIFVGGAGTDGDMVTMPIFFMSYEDCQTIRTFAEGGEIEGFFNKVCPPDPVYGPEVIWGNEPGQGDFDQGLNGWTVESDADSSWMWTGDQLVTGTFTNQTIQGGSCNGYMSFPSDLYDNEGISPSGGVGSLISPTIDLSGQQIDGLFCTFYHEFRVFTPTYTALLVSYDDGVTWPDSILVSGDPFSIVPNQNDLCTPVTTPVNEAGQREFSIPITGYNGEPSIKLQFLHQGSYYYATIDDVRLETGSYFDMSVSQDFYGQAPALRIPADQVQPVPLHVDLNNLGNITATNVTVEAVARDPQGGVATYVNDTYADQPPYCFLNENNTFADFHIPPPIEGTHSVDYTNITADDFLNTNDDLSFNYVVSDTIWESVARPADGSGDQYDGRFRNMFTGLVMNNPAEATFRGYDWALAYSFYLPKGAGKYLNTVRFGVNDKPTNSGDVKVYLYLWNPEEGESFDPNRGQPGQVGIGSYTIPSSDRILLGCMGINDLGAVGNTQALAAAIQGQMDQTDMTITMAVADPSTGTPAFDNQGRLQPLELQDDQQYTLVFAYNAQIETGGSELEMLANNARAGSQWDLSGYNLAMDNNGSPIRTGASINPEQLTNGADFELELDPLTFGSYWSANQPWIEMSISDHSRIVSTENISEAVALGVDVFPNPVLDELFIDVELEQSSDIATFELVDVSGQLIKTMKENNVQSARYLMNVSDVPSGIYTLNVRTEQGFASKKVVIAK